MTTNLEAYLLFASRKPIEKPFLVFELANNIRSTETLTFIQEIVCPQGTHYCYRIEDYEYLNEYSRRLTVDLVNDNVIAEAHLINEQGTPFNAKNSRNWNVDKQSSLMDHEKLLLTQAFVSGALILSNSKKIKRSLVLGLGDGLVSSFIASLPYNNVVTVESEEAIQYIAEKWFDFKVSNVIIQDEVSYLEDRSDWEPKFDLIIVNTCHALLQGRSLLCPTEFFLDEVALQHIYDNLSQHGAVIIKTYITEEKNESDKAKNARKSLFENLKTFFKHCYFASINSHSILTCSHNLSNDINEKKYIESVNSIPEIQSFNLYVPAEIISKL